MTNQQIEITVIVILGIILFVLGNWVPWDAPAFPTSKGGWAYDPYALGSSGPPEIPEGFEQYQRGFYCNPRKFYLLHIEWMNLNLQRKLASDYGLTRDVWVVEVLQLDDFNLDPDMIRVVVWEEYKAWRDSSQRAASGATPPKIITVGRRHLTDK